MTTAKPTMLSVVTEWWRWSEDDVGHFRTWASLNREQALGWLRQEAEQALAQRAGGKVNIDAYIKYRSMTGGSNQ